MISQEKNVDYAIQHPPQSVLALLDMSAQLGLTFNQVIKMAQSGLLNQDLTWWLNDHLDIFMELWSQYPFYHAESKLMDFIN